MDASVSEADPDRHAIEELSCLGIRETAILLDRYVAAGRAGVVMVKWVTRVTRDSFDRGATTTTALMDFFGSSDAHF